jgi:hypothetical protein
LLQDLWTKIFSLVANQKMIFGILPLVCKAWYAAAAPLQVAITYSVHKSTPTNSYGSDIGADDEDARQSITSAKQLGRWLVSNGTQLQALTLHEDSLGLSGIILQTMSLYGQPQYLQELHLCHIFLDGHDLQTLARACPCLESFTLELHEIASEQCCALYDPDNPKSARVVHELHKGLGVLLAAADKLSKLCLRNIHPSHFPLALNTPFPPRLTSLTMEDTFLAPEPAQLTSLHELVWGLRQITRYFHYEPDHCDAPANIMGFSALVKLTRLELLDPFDREVEATKLPMALSSLPGLQHLVITMPTPDFTDAAFACFRDLTALTHLSLQGVGLSSRQATSSSNVLTAFEHLQQLVHLELKGPGVEDVRPLLGLQQLTRLAVQCSDAKRAEIQRLLPGVQC